MKRSIILAAGILFCTMVTAQPVFEMLKDINTSGDAHPQRFLEFQGKLFFDAYASETGENFLSRTEHLPELNCSWILLPEAAVHFRTLK